MKNLISLTDREKEELLKLPAYISLLAANHEGGIDKKERKAAIKFSHIKTYSCRPVLAEFYQEADKVFEENIQQLDNELPKERDAREKAIKAELVKLETIISRLGSDYAATMHHSMETFKNHVSKAHNNVFEYFLFPMPIKGITD